MTIAIQIFLSENVEIPYLNYQCKGEPHVLNVLGFKMEH